MKKLLLISSLFFLCSTILFAGEKNKCINTFTKRIEQTEISELNLRDCHIQDKDIPDLVASLNNFSGKIDMLSLEKNNIHQDGAVVLANIRTIPILALSYNHIGNKGAIALAGNHYFRKLWLNHNDIGEAGALALAKNKNLIALGLEGNHITNAAKSALLKNTSIEDLRLK